MSLFSESVAFENLERDLDESVRDEMQVICKDGSRHTVRAHFTETEYIAEMDQARAKVTERSVVVACHKLNGIDLDDCHWFISTKKIAERYFKQLTVLRISTTHYRIMLEECEQPDFGRKAAVDKFCKPKAKFRNRRKTNIQGELR